MKAQIITIGDEILIGQIIDSNSAWLASQLTELGFVVTSMISISDNKSQIKQAIKLGFEENDLIIFTGGLGPTKDDITKNTLCEYFNTSLGFNNDAYKDVEAFLEQRGAKMNELNRDQALFPEGAELLRNMQGTAPGIWFKSEEKVLISLPGVPWEMKGIFESAAKNKLVNHFELPSNYYQTAIVSGIGESPLALKLSEWESKLPQNIKLAYLPSPGIVKLRLGIVGANANTAKKSIQNEIRKLHELIPEYLVSEYEVTLEEMVFNLLNNSGKSISTAESCTGGTIAQMLTSIPGSSQIFKGSIVAYSNEIKEQLLGVSVQNLQKFGAVSKQVVEEMAEGVKLKFKTDIAIATSGIAGPDGGTPDKPVGTIWVAVSGPNGTVSRKFLFGNDRQLNIRRSANAALNMLRRELANKS